MRITFLGTASGSSLNGCRLPLSFVIQVGDSLYWFDAGEGCSRAALASGLDLLQTRAIFVSHPAMDHIGGMPPLLWSIRKLAVAGEAVGREPAANGLLKVFVPSQQAWQGVLDMVECACKNHYAKRFVLSLDSVRAGDIYRDKQVTVSAQPTSHFHMHHQRQSYCSSAFSLTAEGKKVVFSGDLDDTREILPLLEECDALLIDSAHQSVDAICDVLSRAKVKLGRLVFVHNTGDFVKNAAATVREVEAKLGIPVQVAEDGQSLEI